MAIIFRSRAPKPRAVKAALFDRVFPPQRVAVGDHFVMKPRSRTLLIVLALVAAVWGSIEITGFDLAIIARRGYQFTVILEKVGSGAALTLSQVAANLFLLLRKAFNAVLLFVAQLTNNPAAASPEPAGSLDWGYLSKVVTPLMDTVKMSVMGSAIGSTLALPFAVMASANINRNRAAVALLRVVLNIVRTLPTLVIASICALIFRLGTFAGTVAITLFTFGVVSKMLYESIETIDMGAFEAMEALGASKFEAFWSACMPQILPTYLSHCLYSFEINVRAASILGYVGAGGLGILINERIGWRDYEGLGTVLIALFVVVLIIENTSQYFRRKLS